MMKKYIGDRTFYKVLCVVAIPIMIQNAITNFVGLLDNIMIGQVGTLPMSGVSITNTLLNIFNLAIFGLVSAASLYGAQYAGRKDYEGMRHCLWFKLLFSFGLTVIAIFLFMGCGDFLIHLFMDNGANSASDIALTAGYANEYMHIMLVGLIPFAMSQSIGSTIRETGETRLPMVSSIVAVVVNFVLNLILIFGYLGFPAMGIVGAALATVISRFSELLVIVVGAYIERSNFVFFQHLFQNIRIPGHLIQEIIVRGTPLMMNEILWSMGCSAIMQCYSTRGLDCVAAYNIANVVQSIFFTVCIGMGSAISILVGQKLGAGLNEEAVDMDRKIIFVAFVSCIVLGVILFFTSPFFPMLYNTTDHVRLLAENLLKIMGFVFPVVAVYNCAYFTLRSGGKTVITFLVDSGFTLAISLPLAWILANLTNMDFLMIYWWVQFADIIKVIIGMYLVNKRVWVHNLVAPNKADAV